MSEDCWSAIVLRFVLASRSDCSLKIDFSNIRPYDFSLTSTSGTVPLESVAGALTAAVIGGSSAVAADGLRECWEGSSRRGSRLGREGGISVVAELVPVAD